jgi:hypothetical protein
MYSFFHLFEILSSILYYFIFGFYYTNAHIRYVSKMLIALKKMSLKFFNDTNKMSLNVFNDTNEVSLKVFSDTKKYHKI